MPCQRCLASLHPLDTMHNLAPTAGISYCCDRCRLDLARCTYATSDTKFNYDILIVNLADTIEYSMTLQLLDDRDERKTAQTLRGRQTHLFFCWHGVGWHRRNHGALRVGRLLAVLRRHRKERDLAALPVMQHL